MRATEADGIAYRAASAEDWPTVRDLLAASGLPLAGAQDHLADFILAFRDTRLIGCIGMERYGESALLRSCAIDAECRGAGVASRLTQELLAQARATGIRQMVLLTTTAQMFFPRFGFVHAERDALPAALSHSEEFRGACPASAVAMSLDLPLA